MNARERSRALSAKRRPEPRRKWRRDFAGIAVGSFLLNLAAEALLARLFIPGEPAIPAGVRHFGAALMETLMVFLIYGRGWMVFHRSDWFAAPGGLGWAYILTAAPLMAVVFEFLAVRTGLWSYSARMPVIPVAGIGIVPLIQMTAVPVAVFQLVTKLRKRRLR